MLGRLIRSWRRRNHPATSPNRAEPCSLVAASVFFEARNFGEVERHLRQCLVENPEDMDAMSLLAGTLAETARLEEAGEVVERVLLARPREPQQVCAAAEIHRRAGNYPRALELAGLACLLDPGSAAAWLVRAGILEQLGQNLDAYSAYSRAIALAPGDRDMHSSMLFLLNRTAIFSVDRTLGEHRRWARLHADALTAAAPGHVNTADSARRLRIGYVSPNFNSHVVAFFIEPVLTAHDSRQFEVFCYSHCKRPDGVTTRLKQLAHAWRDISLLDDQAAARLVREDKIDILVDLSGHTSGNRLPVFARKPAPLQVTWFGYPGTTGMKSMDYFIGDPRADPIIEAEAEFSEKILRLPVTQWCFRAPLEAPPVGALPAACNAWVTFGSFSNFLKLNDETFANWAAILNEVPRSRLRIVGLPEGEPVERILRIMDTAGIAAERLELTGKVGYARYFQLLAETDIALGSYPYNGATTICEALWMGVPVVSRIGDRHAARARASILGAIDLERLIARTPVEYVAIASRLANDLDALGGLRVGMRERMLASALMERKSFTVGLEQAYRGIWKQWCATRSNVPADSS
ncbi:MAG: glycosyltransferase [Betaproteobacteria bacterium]|nr:glycosyltransferase [Betaproteobacteria bacterium]